MIIIKSTEIYNCGQMHPEVCLS